MPGGKIVNCPNCSKLVIFGQTCTCGQRSDLPVPEGTTMQLDVDNYFRYHRGCHRLCDVARERVSKGVVSKGARHDPRCAITQTVDYTEREAIARAAERKLGL